MSTDVYRRGDEKVVVTFDDDDKFLHAELYRKNRRVARTTDKTAAEDWMKR